MPNVSSFGAQTDNAVVSGTVTDRQMVIPEVPPQGLMSIGPRQSPNYVKEPWNAQTSYVFYDVVKDGAGASYVATKPVVPAGTALTNEDYWFKWADPNAQINELNEIVKTFNERIAQNDSAITAEVARATAAEEAEEQRATAAEATKAPVNHASEETIYGVGNEVDYGHVKLAADDTPLTRGANDGVAATPKMVFDRARNNLIKNMSAVGMNTLGHLDMFFNEAHHTTQSSCILNNKIFIGSTDLTTGQQGHIHIFNATNGTELLNKDVDAGHFNDMAIDYNDPVYKIVVAPVQKNVLYKFNEDFSERQVINVSGTTENITGVTTDPITKQSYMADSKYLYKINLETGALERLGESPIVAKGIVGQGIQAYDGIIYTASVGNDFASFDTVTGEVVYRNLNHYDSGKNRFINEYEAGEFTEDGSLCMVANTVTNGQHVIGYFGMVLGALQGVAYGPADVATYELTCSDATLNKFYFTPSQLVSPVENTACLFGGRLAIRNINYVLPPNEILQTRHYMDVLGTTNLTLDGIQLNGRGSLHSASSATMNFRGTGTHIKCAGSVQSLFINSKLTAPENININIDATTVIYKSDSTNKSKLYNEVAKTSMQDNICVYMGAYTPLVTS